MTPEPGSEGWVRTGVPHLVADPYGRIVASLPGGVAGGEVITRAGTWTIAAERARHGWAVAARASTDGREVATAHPRWRLRSYDIEVPPGGRYRLKGNVFTHSWSLHGSGGCIARLVSGRTYVSSIRTFDTPLDVTPLALLIVIALELDRMETSIPEGQQQWVGS